jgi:nitrous oxidase accessory protein
MTPRRGGFTAGLLLAVSAEACAPAPPQPGTSLRPTEPRARPESCIEVDAGASLQPILDRAADGDTLCLAPGEYAGSIRIERGVTLFGPREAIVRSNGEGTTVRMVGDRSAVVGLTVHGSGRRFDLLDGAIHVQARDARVEGVLVRDALFGILVERSSRAVIRANEIVGDPRLPFGRRGDSIRLWETTDSSVESNAVYDGRDLVVWYSSRNRITGNVFVRGRYGTHLMYSHGVEIEDNRYVANVTGIFVMYSRGIGIRRNIVADSGGAAGMGLGLKESGGVHALDNFFVHNTVGIYIDASPLWPDDHVAFERNALRLSDVGVAFLANPTRVSFRQNQFRDNRTQVRVDGRGDALGAEWNGNDFDDYAGYDLDDDGTGDVPYELRDVSSELAGRYPAVALFRGSAALALLEIIGRVVPIAQPRLLLVDCAPRLRPWEPARAS